MSRLKRYARATIAFLGPVAGAIQGVLSKPEIARAGAKFLVVGVVTRASLASMAKDQDFLTDFVVPLTAGTIAGVLDALSRLNQGDPRPEPAPITEDEPPPVPLPTNPESQP